MKTWIVAVLISSLAPAVRAADETEIEARTMTLICELDSGDARVRRQAAIQLGRLSISTKEGVQALIGALEDPDKTVRRNAVRSLGKIGPKARKAISALKKGVAKERLCPCSVDNALKKIGPEKKLKEAAKGSTDGRAVPVEKPVLTKPRKSEGDSR